MSCQERWVSVRHTSEIDTCIGQSPTKCLQSTFSLPWTGRQYLVVLCK
jgi:hypothetical protein